MIIVRMSICNLLVTIVLLQHILSVELHEIDREIVSNNVDQKTIAVRKRVKRAEKTDTSKTSLTHDEKINLVSKHNELRKAVSPAAANMRFMTWDPELESMAQEWANQCDWAHGQPSRATPPYSWIGQNLYAKTGSYDEVSGVQLWFDEVADFDYGNNICNDVCGHYTQVVWADSYKLGCGIAYCATMTTSSLTDAYYMVCNYGPGGNVNIAVNPPYESGVPCSNCPAEMPTCEADVCRADPLCGAQVCPAGTAMDTTWCECLDAPGSGSGDGGTEQLTVNAELVVAVLLLSLKLKP